jgi:hypothetical protein
MTVLPFRPKSPARDTNTEVIVAALEVITRFITEGGNEDGDSDLEAFVKALREEMYHNENGFQFRFNFDPDQAS